VDSVTIVRGDRQFVFDDAGGRYLDGVAGLWYTLIGHGRAEIAEAVAKQMKTLEAFQTHGFFDNPPALELAAKLGSLFPIDDPLVFFSSGGGDAIESACKLSREYWRIQGYPEKSVMISRENAYHGMQGFGTGLAGIGRLRSGFEDGFPSEIVANNDVNVLESTIYALGPDRVAGFLVEPVIGAGGVVLPTEGYLKAVEEVCKQNSVLLICDEVITGFGRMGTWSGAEYYGIRPDIVAVAKGITSGYLPLGAVLASRAIWKLFEEQHEVFRHGYTYSGHPSSCAAALANLAILEEEQLLKRASESSALFGERLLTLTENPAITGIRHVGLMAGIELDHAGIGSVVAQRGGDLGATMVRRCLERGLIVRRMFQGDLQISPPLVIEDDDIQYIRDAVADAADSVLIDYAS
jgi:adenosylmethionine-8-amino-7-oxononanoate aminotransferase